MSELASMGILYVVTGSKAMAEFKASVKSVRTAMPSIPITLVIPEEELETIPPESREALTQVLHLPLAEILPLPDGFAVEHFGRDRYLQRCQGLAYKVQALALCPYETTLFLDADTFIKRDVTELFSLSDHFDVSLALDQFDRSLCDPMVPAYTPYNTGVMLIKKSPITQQFLNDWLRIYEAAIHQYPSDQTAFMAALKCSTLKTYCLPAEYNFKINAFQVVSRLQPAILHGRAHFGWERVVSELNKATTTPHVWQIWNSQTHRLSNQTHWVRGLKEALRPFRTQLLPLWRLIRPSSISITR
jgi:hypothetical protein